MIENNKKLNNLVLMFFSLSLLFMILRTAWISDDAAITLRTVLNLTNGFGPNFNIAERVQAYTHPLWFLILTFSSIFFSNVFHATFFVSIFLSFVAIYLLLWKFRRNLHCVLIISILMCLSKAFIDFSTSGLENPLSHSLLVYFVLFALPMVLKDPKKLTHFYLLCSAVYLNRPDLSLLIFPAIILVTYKQRHNLKVIGKAMMIGILPVLVWTTFSLIYYGFPFSNTSYAKLGNGIRFSDIISQGFVYLLHVIDRDPLTIFIMIMGILIGFTRQSYFKALSIGMVFYNLYIVYIGGDFMEGRFYTVPFLISLMIIGYTLQALSFRQTIIVSAIPILFLGSVNVPANILIGSNYPRQPVQTDGIADERAYYFWQTNLLRSKSIDFYYPDWQADATETLITCGGIGFSGVRRGPNLHIIDECALTDPFLARLNLRTDIQWRIGHFYRKIPEKYEESILKNQNLLENPCARELYDSIRKITRDPIFDGNRLLEVLKFNLRTFEGSVKC